MFTEIYIKEIQQIKLFLEANPISNEIPQRVRKDVISFHTLLHHNIRNDIKKMIDQSQKILSPELKIIAQMLDTCEQQIIYIITNQTKIREKIFRFLRPQFDNRIQQIQVLRIYRKVFAYTSECPSTQIIRAIIRLWLETQDQILKYSSIYSLLIILVQNQLIIALQFIVQHKLLKLMSDFLLNLDQNDYEDETIINLSMVFCEYLVRIGKNQMQIYGTNLFYSIQCSPSLRKQAIEQIQLFLQPLVVFSIKFKDIQMDSSGPLGIISKIFSNILSFTYKIDDIDNIVGSPVHLVTKTQIQIIRKMKITNQFFISLAQSQNYQTILNLSKIMEVMVSDMNLDQFNTIIVPFLQKNLGNTKFYYQNNPADPSSKLLQSLCILISKFVRINLGKPSFNMKKLFEQTNIMFIMFNHLQKQYEMFLQVLNREKHRQTRKVMNMCEQSKLKEVLITFMTMIQVGQWEYKINNQIENVLCQSVILVKQLMLIEYSILEIKLNMLLEKVHPQLSNEIIQQNTQQLEI